MYISRYQKPTSTETFIFLSTKVEGSQYTGAASELHFSLFWNVFYQDFFSFIFEMLDDFLYQIFLFDIP